MRKGAAYHPELTRRPPPEPRPLRDDVRVNPPREQTVDGPMMVRAAEARGGFDEGGFSIDAIVATPTPVMRRDAAGPYAEVLDPTAFRLPGEDVPLVDEHQRGSTRHVIGRAFDFRLEDGNVVATLRFSMADDIAPIVQRVRDGTLKHFSVGYRVARWQDSTDGGKRIRTATDWQISEVSLVGQPADPNARRIRKMPDIIEELEDVTVEPTTGPEAARVRALAEAVGFSDDETEGFIRSGLCLDDVRTIAQTRTRERSAAQPRIRTASAGTDHTDPDEIRHRAEGALVAGMEGSEVPEESREFAGMSLSGLAAHLLIARGERVRHGESPETILTRAAQHTVSDFSNLLTGAGNRVIQNAYTAAQSPLVGLCRQATLPDFRAKTLLRLGEVSTLSKITESGEIKSVSRNEVGEGYSLDSYAAMFSLSRKAIINDDLGAFGDWGRAAGQAAANTEAALVWSLLSASSGAGPLMGEDGKRLFSATHGNLMTGAALSIESLGAARLVLRTRKGLDGVTPIQVKPTTLLVGPALETTAEKVLADISAASVDNVNPFSGKLTLAVEPRIEDGQWFVFSDLPTIEIGHLASAPGPQVSTRDGWEVLGREFRVVLDVGAGAVDWRGAVRNPGAA